MYLLAPQLLCPVYGSFTVTQYFGENRVGAGAYSRYGILADQHNGIDYAAGSSPLILAAHAGVVSCGFDPEGYGNWLRITCLAPSSEYGFLTLYAHLAAVTVPVGRYVEPGAHVGIMGATGNSTGVHLHFGLKLLGTGCGNPAYLDWINPYPFRMWEYQ